ncbi:MAG: gliding motility-associated C-terminal domain-containing protein, partial [Bacteroidota bacterium]|nr:gliding motility-associated C-terminal domain-containing protein [Bacteroidota bacterium]
MNIDEFIKVRWGDEIDTLNILLEDILVDESNNPVALTTIPGLLHGHNPPSYSYNKYKLPFIFKFNINNNTHYRVFSAPTFDIKNIFFLNASYNHYCHASSDLISLNASTGDATYNSGFMEVNTDSLINEPYFVYNYHNMIGSLNLFQDTRNALFKYNKFFIFNEVYSSRYLPFTMIMYKYLTNTTWKLGDSKAYLTKYSRKDSNLLGKRGFMYFWGDTTNFKLWFIEEEWKNCVNRLAYYDDTLSFIEIWGMDTTVNLSASNHCTLPTTMRKMTFSGDLIWEKQLPIKLHYTDIRRDKSPFLQNKNHFFLIDNANTDSNLKGPYFNNFTLYKFDTSGNIILSNKLKIPFDFCGRASFPYPDACNKLYFIFQNVKKNKDSLVSKYTLYKIDSLGNILWSNKLPSWLNWYGAKNMVIDNDNGIYLASCSNDSIVYIKFRDRKPDISKQSKDTLVCINKYLSLYISCSGDFSYQWQKNGKDINGAESQIYNKAKISLKDTGVYRCIVSNCFEADTTNEIIVKILNDNFFDTVYVCKPDSFYFGGKYLKETKDITYNYTNFLACDSIVHLNFIAYEQPQKNLPKDSFFCAGKSILLDAGNPGATYLWNTQSTAKTIKVNNEGKYFVTITKNICSIIDTTQIKEISNPLPFLGKDTILCLDKSSLFLDAGSWFSYHWYPGNETERIIEIIDEGIYSVVVKNEFDCQGIDTILVKSLCNYKIFIPNAFSPNDDGVNEIFTVVAPEILSFELQIYNRWGEKIFESNDQNKGWNGKFK